MKERVAQKKTATAAGGTIWAIEMVFKRQGTSNKACSNSRQKKRQKIVRVTHTMKRKKQKGNDPSANVGLTKQLAKPHKNREEIRN